MPHDGGRELYCALTSAREIFLLRNFLNSENDGSEEALHESDTPRDTEHMCHASGFREWKPCPRLRGSRVFA